MKQIGIMPNDNNQAECFLRTCKERIMNLIKQMEFEDILLFCERMKANMPQQNKNFSGQFVVGLEMCNFCLKFSKNFAFNKNEMYSFELNKEYFYISHQTNHQVTHFIIILNCQTEMIDKFVSICLKYVYILKTPNKVNSANASILNTEFERLQNV